MFPVTYVYAWFKVIENRKKKKKHFKYVMAFIKM